ncbi:MAG: hydantoinase/oxoprolinase family protein [Sphingobium sp.]
MALVSVDVGGTFTDVVAVRNGVIETTKVPTDLIDTAAGVLRGADEVGVGDAIMFNHSSTAGLNALLTRRLPKIGLLTTMGQRDVLDIGNSWRPHDALTNPRWRRSFGDAKAPLVPRYLRRTVTERLKADGSIFIPLDEEQARKEIRILGRCNVEGVAICLIHSWINGGHERRLAELVKEELGDIPVVLSHKVSPLVREYPRMSTTAIDTLMGIIYGEYSRRLEDGLAGLGFKGALNFGDCAAMLAPVENAMERPSRAIFSGPAAGTTASAYFGRMIEENNLICADVGGTSTDVSIVLNGRPIVNASLELEPDMVINTLSNEIASVGAGGGSIVSVGGAGEIVVGPDSAGSYPGPACYGRGGTRPTMTDACLMIGILDAERFLGGKGGLDMDRARTAFKELDTPLGLEQRVHDAFRIGLNNIAEGVLDIVIRNGIDPRDFAMVAYGAAGPMLLPAIAEAIKVKKVIIPPHPGLFSAIGLTCADLVFMENRRLQVPLADASAADIDRMFRALEEDVRGQLGEYADKAVFHRSFDAKLTGQAFETAFIDAPSGIIDAEAVARMNATFHDIYEQRSGTRFDRIGVETVNMRVRAVVDMPKAEFAHAKVRESGSIQPVKQIEIRYLSDTPQIANVYERDDLCLGDRVNGPAIIHERLSTIYLTAGQVMTVGAFGEFIVEMEDVHA